MTGGLLHRAVDAGQLTRANLPGRLSKKTEAELLGVLRTLQNVHAVSMRALHAAADELGGRGDLVRLAELSGERHTKAVRKMLAEGWARDVLGGRA